MHIYIGNKVYSSWSMRPWLVLKAFGIAFDETVLQLELPDFKARVSSVSGAGKVPVLVDGSVVVWETLAIIEYLAERFPDKAIWPADPAARAHARSVSSEMHAGFGALRSACPMNLAKRFARRDRGADVGADVARLQKLWGEARARLGEPTGEPFLYGAFSGADAMFAPVVARLHGYDLVPNDEACRRYVAAVMGHPAVMAWRADALKEPWVVPEDEVDEPALEDLRGLSPGTV